MAIIKIILEKDETEEEVNECLCKALMHQHGGEDRFDDPVLDNIEQEWNKLYRKTLEEMFKEVDEYLEYK